MKKVFLMMLVGIIFVAQGALADVTIQGNADRLNYGGWLPKKAYIAFHYDSQDRLTGYRVIFQADGGELFNEWKMKKSDGTLQTFPFIMESTLVIEDGGEIEETSSHWGFGRLDGDNSSVPSAYIDSTLCDIGTDNYGIGIVNPIQLEEDILYDYWVGLEEATDWFPIDPHDLSVKLRFRLNMDLSEAKKFGYTKDEIDRDFEIGSLWSAGFYTVNTSQNYSDQEIGDFFSFAVEKYKPASDKKPYSYYFVLSGMEGQWCNDRDGVAYKVSSIAECFGDDQVASIPDVEYGDTKEDDDSPGSQTTSNPPSSSSKPELFIKKFYFGSSGRTHYYTDENITLYSQEKNVGIDVNPDTNVPLGYYRFEGEKENGDTKKVGSDNIKGSNLKHNQVKTESIKVAIPDDEGKYQYYACVDSGKKVSESNEKNNCSKPLSIRAHERPDLALIDLTLNGGATNCEYGDSPFIQATIENSGGEPFEDVPVVWQLDDIHYVDDNIRHWNIAHGDIKHEDVYLPDDLSVGIHTVKACYELEDDEDQSDSCLELSFEVTNQVLRADVDGSGVIDTADAMLILSKSAGKDMSQTDWIDSSITGDANCSGETTTTDALLVMRKSNGLPMEETAWCLEE